MARRTVVFLMLCVLNCSVFGEEPVNIPDPNLKAAIEAALHISDPNAADMLKLISFSHSHITTSFITDVTGLEYATNLTELKIGFNKINNISPLAGLTNLTYLALMRNQISDITPLAEMTNLTSLFLHGNNIRDISSLAGFKNLKELTLQENYLNTEAYSTFLPLIIENNPSIDVQYDLSSPGGISASDGTYTDKVHITWDSYGNSLGKTTYLVSRSLYPSSTTTAISDWQESNSFDDSTAIPGIKYYYYVRVKIEFDDGTYKQSIGNSYDSGYIAEQFNLAISSTLGGNVTEPGEGTFEYEKDSYIEIQAISDPNFIFKNWTGTSADAGKVSDPNSSITYIIVDANYTLAANFKTTQTTLYVGTSDPNDPNEYGTAENPITNLQNAIDVVSDDNEVTIFVSKGTYIGSLILTNNIHLQVQEPNDQNDPNEYIMPTIIGDLNKPAITYVGDANSMFSLKGFAIKSGIVCDKGFYSLENCIFTGSKDYGITIYDSNVVVINCTITGNGTDKIDSGGIGLWGSNNVTIVNTILYNNFPYNVKIWSENEPNISYSSIGVDPLFTNNGYWADANDLNTVIETNDPNATWIDGDYHLMSETGRWDSALKTWIQDLITSPCINAGDPNYPINKEPEPNGNIINMGAYGGTPQASMSMSEIGDI